MYFYSTLARVRAEIKAQNTTDDDWVMQGVAIVSARINELLSTTSNRPYFLPYVDTQDVILSAYNLSTITNTLLVPYPLLSLSAISINGIDITSDVRLYPPSKIPTLQIQLSKHRSWLSFYNSSNFIGNVVVIEGTWGYNSNYANAWQAVDAITVAGINASVTSFTVADVDGLDPYGFAPRISAGNYIKIGNEVMLVIATNIATNVVTVKRAVLGTSASAHLLGASVSVYQVEPTISRVVARQVGAMYARRGAYEGVVSDGVGTITYPPDLLPELKNVLTVYAGGV